MDKEKIQRSSIKQLSGKDFKQTYHELIQNIEDKKHIVSYTDEINPIVGSNHVNEASDKLIDIHDEKLIKSAKSNTVNVHSGGGTSYTSNVSKLTKGESTSYSEDTLGIKSKVVDQTYSSDSLSINEGINKNDVHIGPISLKGGVALSSTDKRVDLTKVDGIHANSKVIDLAKSILTSKSDEIKKLHDSSGEVMYNQSMKTIASGNKPHYTNKRESLNNNSIY